MQGTIKIRYYSLPDEVNIEFFESYNASRLNSPSQNRSNSGKLP